MKNDNRISRTVGRLLAHPMAGLAVVIGIMDWRPSVLIREKSSKPV